MVILFEFDHFYCCMLTPVFYFALFHCTTMSDYSSPTVSTAQQAQQYDLKSLPTSLDEMGSKKEFMMMLQDAGNKRNGALVFNKIGGWARDWIKRVTPYNIPGMPTNSTHAKEFVVDIILTQHKILKHTEIYCELLECIPSNGGNSGNIRISANPSL